MGNKELPQEIVNEISNAIMVHNNPNATKKIVAVVKSHYLKELQAKDTTIKELQAKNEKLTGLLETSFRNGYESGKPFVRLIADEEGKTYEEYVNEQWEYLKEQHGI